MYLPRIRTIMDIPSSADSDELTEYDIYGKTPPRTKISRKNRERKQKERILSTKSTKVVKVQTPSPATIDIMYDNNSVSDENSEEIGGSKRTSKRQMQLLRGSERDLKLDIARAQAINTEDINDHQDTNIMRTPSYQIESYKRFKSLVCRTFPCQKQELNNVETKVKFNPLPAIESTQHDAVKCPTPRVEFYETLRCLVRMGGGTSQDKNRRRGITREEVLWQNELKDLIWLELQAYHADRTPMEQDDYLCAARECVEPLLDDIKNYKFQRHVRRYSFQNSDSGVEDDCPGCISVYCLACMESQNEALRDVDNLLMRLEEAESLFPSSKAFAELYPLYSSPEIVGRVKAMCLWYNLTKHHRLKLNILGRLLTTLDSKHTCWAISGDDTNSGSPSDSKNSTTSSSSDSITSIRNDLFNITPLATLLFQTAQNKVSPYRRYIENVLKIRALDKSLNFLNHLHRHLLKKAQLTLVFPEDEEIFSEVNFYSEAVELQRFGAWSPEAKSLNLPSYRSMFVLLAMVPLEVLHEYLMMRLEQKPKNPSHLSIRQLMRELKEGLKLAIKERHLSRSYIKAATWGTEIITENYQERLESFDKCLKQVFIDFLDYLQQWILFDKSKFQKDVFEEEYKFSVFVYQNVPDVKEKVGNTFTFISGTILQRIGQRLITRIEEILSLVINSNQGMNKHNLFSVCRELQTLFNEEREMSLKTMFFLKTNYEENFAPSENMKFVGESIIALKCIIPDAIGRVQRLFDHISTANLDDCDKTALNIRIREILMQVYRFGFEFYKEMGDSTPAEYRPRLVESLLSFAKLWMKFVTERCERGRGMRPRWAHQGMEFLLTVCEPANTKHLSEEMFEDLKKDMDVCISHVIGTTAPSTPESGFHSASTRSSLEHVRARSRGSSPSPRPTYKSQRSKGRKISTEQQSPVTDYLDAVNLNSRKEEKADGQLVRIRVFSKSHTGQFQEAVKVLETELNNKLIKQNLIGKVFHNRTANKNIQTKNVTFSWQRGIKIGQGRFGKVYGAVNNNTGDMMAVKEIPLQHDTSSSKHIAEEIKILEGIVNKNLVRYYGVEVHKDEMLIFMEYCSEGTLESLIAGTERGLTEPLCRRYTFQLVSGVACLHEHGIVHRDIKTANLFLTNGGNCLKIGDFGCAAKIKSNITMPGELKGFVGTQAYMAPEVFTKNMSEGHGRAADIWSIGCVVVEMVSGKRPWFQYDSNFQIMFKVGMGQSPDPPDDITDEGLDFLDMCFKHEPKERATASELLNHNFVKIGEDLL
ncbi:mitogen-activated protein kinase kinase kinase 4 isoform X2 [Leptinotarsa decemlineata]|uniref:mitogen-activated protein kinase kinase kinase 4 isoform X2 n=1 Tax=Leptinotarsa decemlineata TaxID=7539 RepID=UPI003D30CC9E